MTIRVFALAFVGSLLCACAGTDSSTSRFGAPVQQSARSERGVHPAATTSPIGGVPASLAIPAVGVTSTFSAAEDGATFSATSSNTNIVTVANLGPNLPDLRHPVRRKAHGKSPGTCFGLTGVAVGTATVTVSDGLGDSVVVDVRVQIPILLSVPTVVAVQAPGDTLTFTAGVDAPGVELSASSTDPTIASIAPAAAAARERHPGNHEASMTTNQRFTITGAIPGHSPSVCWVTVSSTDPTYSSVTIYVIVDNYGESFSPDILDLNRGESGNVMVSSGSFDETATSVTSSLPSDVTITRPYANGTIFDVAGTHPTSGGGQITITSNKGSYLADYVWVEPISASPENLALPAVGQTLSVTVSEPAPVTFLSESYDTTVATVSAGASSSGATSTATFVVKSVGVGQTVIRIYDNLNSNAWVDVIVGKPLTTTPSALAFTAIGQQKTFAVNLPQNDTRWWATAASSNTSIVKVASSDGPWTAMAVAPGKATIYLRNAYVFGAGLGEVISIPVDVTSTGGVIH